MSKVKNKNKDYRQLSNSISVREYRPVENVSRCRLHSVRNASCGWIAFLPSDTFLPECTGKSCIPDGMHSGVGRFFYQTLFPTGMEQFYSKEENYLRLTGQ
jgi:hypothetical protein